MALNSVNTNFGAAVALQNLNKTNSQLSTTQNRINTGLAISSAKDNGAIYAIAQSQRADVTALNAVSQSLNRGQSVVDVALAAGESISDLLGQLKEVTVSLADTGIKDEAREALVEGYKSIISQINDAANGASFNGVNLLTGDKSDATKNLNVISGLSPTAAQAASGSGSTATPAVSGKDMISLKSFNFTSASTASNGVNMSSIASFSAGTDASSAALAATRLAEIDTVINNVSSALSALGTGSKQLENQASFISKLSDSMEAGIGNLVDADLAKESSRLQALQTKQQLGIQALSIANQSTSTVLSLFR
ncbi:MAG: flagellin [Asticcacaulis sp.]